MSIHDKIAWAREKYGVSLTAAQLAPDWHEVRLPSGEVKSFTAATMDTFEAWADKMFAPPAAAEPEPVKTAIRRSKP